MVLQVFLIIFYDIIPIFGLSAVSIIDYLYHHIPIRSISEIQKIYEIVTERNVLEISSFLD